MNKIKAHFDQSDFKIYEDYLNYKIDDHFLDEILQFYYPGPEFKGLVPTLLPWLIMIEERAIVWERILPMVDTTTYCPVLMCPDHCDFSCSLVVVEIERQAGKVMWKRLGSNRNSELDPAKVGENIDWLTQAPSFEFAIEDYQNMLKVFNKALVTSSV